MFEGLFININEIFTQFSNYSKLNPIIAGAISLWGLGVFSYFMRNIPKKLWNLFCKHTTTELTLLSSHDAYHSFLSWLKDNDYLKHARSFKITSGMYGSDESINSIGYGSHYFLYKLRPFRLHLEQQETRALNERDIITITILGRSYKFFNMIFDDITEKEKNINQLKIYKYKESYWNSIPNQYKRKLNKIFINNSLKQDIMFFIEKFIKSESWYLQNGISYQTGILIYGPSGTGKSSLIKSLASHYNKPLYILPVSKLHSIEESFDLLPEHVIILIEDIDADSITHKRTSDIKYDEKNSIVSTTKTPVVKNNTPKGINSNLSDILNSIDGVVSGHGRILIATTNYIDKLSLALIRNGRFDLKIELTYINYDITKQFFKNYFPEFDLPVKLKLKDKISPADIQQYILKNIDNPNKVLDLITL